MDWKKTIEWLLPSVIRLMAGYLAVKFGMEVAEANETATQIGSGLAALAIAGVSLYTSYKGRARLASTASPEQDAARLRDQAEIARLRAELSDALGRGHN